MALPKGRSIGIVADYRAMNRLVPQSAMLMLRLKELRYMLSGAAAFCTLDMIQGYWQTPLHPDERELSSIWRVVHPDSCASRCFK